MVEEKVFGKTGEKIFPIGLGTYGHGEAYGGISKEESFNILKLVINNSLNTKILIDTAPRYGNGRVEEWIGEFIKNYDNKFLIATKCGRHIEEGRINEKDFSEEFLRSDLENSLKRLGLKQIFLYQLHNPSLDSIKEGKIFDILEEFRKEGRILWYGISIDKSIEGLEAIKICKERLYNGLASIQVIYNILNKEANDLLFKKAEEENIAIITREVLLRGFLAGKYMNNNDFDKFPEAVMKQIEIYGKDKLINEVEKIKKIIRVYNFPIVQTAINFSISNRCVTTTLIGINRVKYFHEDWNSINTKVPKELTDKLNVVPNLK
ncbi:MAG: aldo/keto reductase [Nanoarchaeota archaeon]